MTYTPDDLITARLMLAFDDLEPPDTLFERIRGGIAGLLSLIHISEPTRPY